MQTTSHRRTSKNTPHPKLGVTDTFPMELNPSRKRHIKEGDINNVVLCIVSLIKSGKNQAEVSSELNLSKRQIQRYYKVLRVARHIERKGYGVWEVKKEGDIIHPDHSIPPQIRSHGFGFYLKIPKFRNWSNRATYLKEKGILFKSLKLGSTPYQKFIFKNFHISLFNEGIKFISIKNKDSFYSNSATLGNEKALFKIKEVIKALESMFKVGLEINKQYHVKITRQHHALIKNELANQYNNEGKKLNVFNEQGLWLLIDKSLNLDELETVHKDSASQDMDNAIKPFFNSLKEVPFTAYDFKALYDHQMMYAENIKLHLSTLTEIKEYIKELRNMNKERMDNEK